MRVATMPLKHTGGAHRPRGIIVHAMAEFLELGDVDQDARSYLDKVGLSAHAFVHPSGTVVRAVPDELVAFHARGFNAGWLGVEILVPGVHTYSTFLRELARGWCTDAGWRSAVRLVQEWRARWDIPVQRVLRHSDVAPERKYDPGEGFAWGAFKESVRL